MLYYQQDVLKFDPRFIGFLQLLGGAGGIVGAAFLRRLCRRVPLEVSLIAGIVVNAREHAVLSPLRLGPAAALIDTAAGLVGMLASLPLYDLAARATPAGSRKLRVLADDERPQRRHLRDLGSGRAHYLYSRQHAASNSWSG